MISIALHAMLLDDARRTRAFGRALAEVVRPGDVVADLGCGTGILSLLALQAGASRVYAVEEGRAAWVARAVARENGVADRMRVIRGRSQRIRLPERVDVVVTETLGHLVLDEGILEIAADARRRFLRRGGRFVPSRVRVMGAPAAAPGGRSWSYGVALGAVRALALHTPTVLPRPRLLGPPRVLAEVELGRDEVPVEASGRWRVREAAGLAVWFDADLSPSVRLASLRSSSWSPTFVPARRPRRGRFEFGATFGKDGALTWRFDGDAAQDTALGSARRYARMSRTTFP